MKKNRARINPVADAVRADGFATSSALGGPLVALLASTGIALIGMTAFAHLPAVALCAPAVGVAAGLGTRDPRAAAALGALGMLLGYIGALLLPPDLEILRAQMQAPPVTAVAVAVLVAAAVAYFSAVFRGRTHVIAPVALAIIVVCGAWSAVAAAAEPQQGGISLLQYVDSVPEITTSAPDEILYLRYAQAVASGAPYHASAADILYRAGLLRGPLVNLQSPLSIRPPTLYVFFGALGFSALSYVMALLLVGGVAAVGAYLMTRRFVTHSLALLSAALVMGYYSTMSWQLSLFSPELWAGALGLIAGSLLIASASKGYQAVWVMWAAAGVAALAAVTREHALGFLIVGLIATVADPVARERRAWLPWIAGGAAALTVLGLHLGAASSALAALPTDNPGPMTSVLTWLDPDGMGLVAGVIRIGYTLLLAGPVAWLLWTAGVVGSVSVTGRPAVRIWLGLCVVGGSVALAVLRPPGSVTATGLPPGYWMDLLVPMLLACAPLAVLALRRRGGPA